MSVELEENNQETICFQGTNLPRSMIGISILVEDDDLPESVGDWIWTFSCCRGALKRSPAPTCQEMAGRTMDHMLEKRGSVLQEISERLGSPGIDPDHIYSEWMTGLSMIRRIASTVTGDCSWIAGEQVPHAEANAMRLLELFKSGHFEKIEEE